MAAFRARIFVDNGRGEVRQRALSAFFEGECETRKNEAAACIGGTKEGLKERISKNLSLTQDSSSTLPR
jgi:hypothetical protein